MDPGARGGRVGKEWSQTVKSSLFESQKALFVLASLCEIRVLGWFEPQEAEDACSDRTGPRTL
jgi:hypothetical protein